MIGLISARTGTLKPAVPEMDPDGLARMRESFRVF